MREIVPPDEQGEAVGRAWPWVLAGLVFVIISPVTATLARTASGDWFVFLVVAQVLATGLAFLIPQWRQITARRKEATAEEREIEARVDTRVAMNDALDPILHLLGNLALEPDVVRRNQLRAQVIPLVLKTAAEFIGPDRIAVHHLRRRKRGRRRGHRYGPGRPRPSVQGDRYRSTARLGPEHDPRLPNLHRRFRVGR